MRGRKGIVLVAIGLLLLSLLTTGALAAPSNAKVSTFEDFQAALEDAKVGRIELMGNIDMEDAVYIGDGKSAIVIDGKGYTLTANNAIYLPQGKQKISLEFTNMAIAYSGGDAFLSEEADEKRSVRIAFTDVFYNGGSLVYAPNGEVTLTDCSANFTVKASASSFIKAKKIEVKGSTNLHDDYPLQGAPILRADDGILFDDNADVEIIVKAKEPNAQARYGATYTKYATGALDLLSDAVAQMERVKNVSIEYDGLDLCTHEHDDFCGGLEEDGVCTHVCADEKYACCLNVLMASSEKAKFAPAKSYDGSFQVAVEYLDGNVFKSSRLSSLTYDKLRGAVKLHIAYKAPGSVDVRGELIWDDEKNEYDTRPDSVVVVLYRNGVKTDERTKVKKGEFTFDNVAYQDEDGDKYTYTVRLEKSLKPLYTTQYNDKKNTITNELVLNKVTVKHVNVATDELIGKAEKYKVPYGKSFTAKALDAKKYPQYELINTDAATVYKDVKGDLTITFKYNEMIRFAGKHVFNEGKGDARGTKDVRFDELSLRLYQNVMGEEGKMPEPEDLGELLDDIVTIQTDKKGSIPYETPFSWRKYDDDGFEYVYTLVTDPETPHYTQEFTTEKDGSITIESVLEDVTVTVIFAYYDDPTQEPVHTGANGTPATPKDSKEDSFTVKYGAKIDYQGQPTWKGFVLNGIRAKCGSYEVDTLGESDSIKAFPALGDVEITAAYIQAK